MGVEACEVVAGSDIFVPEGGGASEECGVNFAEDVGRLLDEFFLVREAFFGDCLVAALDAELVCFEIARADFDADRHAFFHPFPFFHSAGEVAGVYVDAEWVAMERLISECRGEGLAGVEDRLLGVFLGGDGEDDDLLGRDAWREDEAIVIRVCHDQGADEAS